MTTLQEPPAVDVDKLMSFVFRAVDEVGATLNTALVVMGDKLGFYKALSQGGPLTPSELAIKTGTSERYVREWLNAQAAGGYVEYQPDEGRYSLPPEQAVALTDESSPAYLPGFFQIALGSVLDSPRISEAARSGAGVGWHDHVSDVHEGCERFFRPGYNAHLVAEWLPALDGVVEKLERGAKVADVGCGHGASTVLMAAAFPASTFVGSDYHEGSIATARARAEEAAVEDRVTFEVAPAASYPGKGYDLVTMFDCLHDMGDPAGAARHVRESLSEDGTWMIVEPAAGDRVEDNLNPVGRAYYGFSTLLCTPSSLSQPVGLALGAQAGEARIRDIVTSAGFSRFTARGWDTLQHGLRGSALNLVESSEAVGYRATERSRARYPDSEGFVTHDGVRIHYEVCGDGEPAILLMPTWTAVHSRMWKMQIPYLSRHAKVVTFDGRGNGKSDRPKDVDAYRIGEFAADGIAVLDATDTATAVIISESCGALWSSQLAADHPDRVEKIVYIAPAVGLAPNRPERAAFNFDEEYDEYEGWAKYNRHYWLKDYEDFLRFFFSECFNEPHSSKPIEDCIGWALETTPKTLADATQAISQYSVEELRDCLSRIKCPALVIHGSDDLVRPVTQGAALAEAVGGSLVLIEGSGHLPEVRDPVRVNLLLRDFACAGPPPKGWTRSRSRNKKVLFVSSPIGLGHAQRDVAIARALREECPGLEVVWLAQDPVTRVLESHGETIHPASAYLASESGHFESESAEHDLHCFQAWRKMDEILLANFMVLHDIVRDDHYDLWIGDEAWELDHFLHENPELKNSAYAWLTDFVGWLPMRDGGDREMALTADYNAEMIEHIDRYPHLRDRAIFVGEPGDIVEETFGPDLPDIRQWTEQHYTFPGYITGFDPSQFADRAALRDELGYGPDEKICFVTVGGTGVGESLLKRVIASFPSAEKLVAGLRMILVSGPRIDPRSLEVPNGVEVRAFVPDLYRHLAACDVAVVQGGLSTAMELTANRRPFLYFPLRHHFEQNFHVRHRLERYGAGRPMDFGTDGPEQTAQAISDELSRTIDYLPVDAGGARRAARSLAELI